MTFWDWLYPVAMVFLKGSALAIGILICVYLILISGEIKNARWTIRIQKRR